MSTARFVPTARRTCRRRALGVTLDTGERRASLGTQARCDSDDALAGRPRPVSGTPRAAARRPRVLPRHRPAGSAQTDAAERRSTAPRAPRARLRPRHARCPVAAGRPSCQVGRRGSALSFPACRKPLRRRRRRILLRRRAPRDVTFALPASTCSRAGRSSPSYAASFPSRRSSFWTSSGSRSGSTSRSSSGRSSPATETSSGACSGARDRPNGSSSPRRSPYSSSPSPGCTASAS